ncbi:ABC transporter permease [Hoeflea prorocentri]|uniref:ABC transporter permease n=1 Tax=Hoeflea prorocentri TaxID=1922333 RepID=A0A9X3ZIB6_9HYPH|nr:ABC transporter permease [Hoeflea prorocentri]MCY6381838.1 ABC transporter permease [Hoeflea prorocentri]MDA5399638.1 ABC transporter permease [Hoeflea prorocentri]
MAGYLVGRMVTAIPVLFGVALFVFLLLELTPGDPAQIIAGDFATSEQVEAVRVALDLERPAHERFASWVGQMVRGDFGESLFSGLPVSQLIAQRIEPTLVLALMAISIAVAVGVPLGLAAAWWPSGLIARVAMASAVIGFSVPVFVVAFGLVYVFAIRLGWFPVQGYPGFSTSIHGALIALVLPALSLSSLYTALIARVTRAAAMEILSEDYVRTAHAKGLSVWKVALRHVLRNAAVPIVTIIGIGFAALLGGVVVTETVFNIPGLGRLAADSILRRDYPVVQALILLFSAIYVLVNLGVDLAYAFFDPRIKY